MSSKTGMICACSTAVKFSHPAGTHGTTSSGFLQAQLSGIGINKKAVNLTALPKEAICEGKSGEAMLGAASIPEADE
jgi:hypothetical protein